MNAEIINVECVQRKPNRSKVKSEMIRREAIKDGGQNPGKS